MMHPAERALLLDIATRLFAYNEDALMIQEVAKPGWLATSAEVDAYHRDLAHNRQSNLDLDRMIKDVAALVEDPT